MDKASAHLGVAEFERAYAKGRSTGFEEAINLAREWHQPSAWCTESGLVTVSPRVPSTDLQARMCLDRG